MKQDGRITCGKAECAAHQKKMDEDCRRVCGLSSDTLDGYAWQEREI